MMELQVNQEQSTLRFLVKGNIDEVGAEELKSRFKEINISSIKEMVFDFSGVTHIGSAGIGKLLLFYKDMALIGGKIRIENVSATVYELFGVLKLDTIFTIQRA
ncbi:STAS domain-containing protein [Desulfobacterales bacterium HSG16]|nr:STAS domain-containing protein [Desulfobacterales bacterium HSG16]